MAKKAPAHMTANPWHQQARPAGSYVPHQHAQRSPTVSATPTGYTHPLAHKTAGTGR